MSHLRQFYPVHPQTYRDVPFGTLFPLSPIDVRDLDVQLDEY